MRGTAIQVLEAVEVISATVWALKRELVVGKVCVEHCTQLGRGLITFEPVFSSSPVLANGSSGEQMTKESD